LTLYCIPEHPKNALFFALVADIQQKHSLIAEAVLYKTNLIFSNKIDKLPLSTRKIFSRQEYLK